MQFNAYKKPATVQQLNPQPRVAVGRHTSWESNVEDYRTWVGDDLIDEIRADSNARQEQMRAFVNDLKKVAQLIRKQTSGLKAESRMAEKATRGRAAGVDAAGAAMGSIGLIAFAFVVWQELPNSTPGIRASRLHLEPSLEFGCTP